MIFFPAVATPTEDGAWKAAIGGWVFDPGRATVVQEALLSSVLKATGTASRDLTDSQHRNFKQRAGGFFVDSERGRRVSVRVGGETYPLEDCRDSVATPAASSGGDGLFRGCVRIDRKKLGDLPPEGAIPFELAGPASGAPAVGGRIYLLESTGTVVVSDIDDTIKITEVLDLPRMLSRTFYLDFEAVPKMGEVYRGWSRAGSPSLHFYYVSASPWNLYEPLAKFLEANGFPPGSVYLKPFRFKDPNQLLALMTKAPDEYKKGVIAPIIERFPKRCFVLVGDSGEKDPEAYAGLWRMYPTQVARILIRDLTGQGRTAARYAAPFAGLPAGVWDVFDDPSTIQDAIPVGCAAARS